MPPLRRSAVAAAASLAAGASLFGFAAGGVVAIDGDLRAATPTVQTLEVRQTVPPQPRPRCQAAAELGEV